MSPLSFQRHRRYWRQLRATPFEFSDAFGENAAAVLPSPKICIPGPGSWLVTDLDSRMSEAGKLVYAAPVVLAWDRTMLASTLPFHRHAGRFLQFEFTPTGAAAYLRVGWNFVNPAAGTGTGADATIQKNEAVIYYGGGGFVNITDGLDVASPLYPYVAGTSYTHRIYDTGGGWLYYVSKTADLPSGWVLLWERTNSFTHLSSVVPCFNCHSLTGSCNQIYVRQGLAKPAIASHVQPPPGFYVSGAADGMIDVEIKAPTNAQRSLYFRGLDANNYWRLVMDTGAQTLWLAKTVAGVETVMALTSVLWRAGQVYRVRVVMWNNHLRSFWAVNSGPWIDDAFNQTALFGGMAPPGGGGNLVDGDAFNFRWQTGGKLLLN